MNDTIKVQARGGAVRTQERMTKDSGDINILWVASEQTIQGFGVKPHEHNFCHLFYVHQGEAVFFIDDAEVPVRAGQVILANRGVTHGHRKIECPIMKHYDMKFVIFDLDLATVLERVPAVLECDTFMDAILRQIIKESAQPRPSARRDIHSYLLSFLYYITSKYRTQDDSDSPTVNTTGFSAVSKAIIEYMDREYMNDVSLQAIADSVGFNKNYMCSVFKRDSGLTIGECLNMIRIHKAAELISYSDMNLAQVSASTGFPNLSHFNRIFKKVAGIPPGQYRRMYTMDVLLEGDWNKISEEYRKEDGFIYSVLAGKKLDNETALGIISRDRDREE